MVGWEGPPTEDDLHDTACLYPLTVQIPEARSGTRIAHQKSRIEAETLHNICKIQDCGILTKTVEELLILKKQCLMPAAMLWHS